MSNEWAFEIENKVFTIVKAKASKKLSAKYPNITFTSSDKNEITKFPTVYIHKLPGLELGNDLENDEINADKITFQVDVYSDKSQSVAQEVAKVISLIFKEMRFNIISPSFQNEDTVFRSTMRFSRVLGNSDIL